MHKAVCGTCGKEYLKNDQVAVGCNDICYDCALKGLIGDGGPEEPDINTALLQSGEISGDDLACFRRELEAVDHSGICSDCGRRRCCCDPSEQMDEDEDWSRS